LGGGATESKWQKRERPEVLPGGENKGGEIEIVLKIKTGIQKTKTACKKHEPKSKPNVRRLGKKDRLRAAEEARIFDHTAFTFPEEGTSTKQ